MCYFDTIIYCNMVAMVIIFIVVYIQYTVVWAPFVFSPHMCTGDR